MAAIVHLVGYPASGKYTVARALCELAAAQGLRFVLLDNHLTGNVILSVVDTGHDGIVPLVVWDRVDEIREVLYRSIEDLAPPEWSFVFTNVLTRRDPEDAATVERLAALAAASGRVYAPVHVRCALDELLVRVTSSGRAERHKWTVPDAVRSFVESTEVVDLGAHHPLALDTTHLAPEQSAELVLEHLSLLQRPLAGGEDRPVG